MGRGRVGRLSSDWRWFLRHLLHQLDSLGVTGDPQDQGRDDPGHIRPPWGCIFQFDAATGPDSFLAQAGPRKLSWWWSDGDNASFIGNETRLSSFVEDDVVLMKVVSLGSYSCDTQAGGNTTVPQFEVVSITRKGGC